MSGRTGTSLVVGSPQLLHEGYVLGDDTHSGTLVQPRRAGGVLRIDLESDTPATTLVELLKHMLQQRQSDAAAPPLFAHTEHVDPPASPALRPAACNPGDPIFIACDEPE